MARSKKAPPAPKIPWCGMCMEFHPDPESQDCRDKAAKASELYFQESERQDRVDRLRRQLEIGESLAAFLVGLEEQLEAKDAQIKALTERLERDVVDPSPP